MHFKNNKFLSYQNAIILASFLPIIVFAFLIYNESKEEVEQSTFEHIQTINLQKTKAIQNYFTSLEFYMEELTKTITFLEKQAKNNIINIQVLQKNNVLEHYRALENDVISLSKKDVFQYIYSFLNRGKNVEQVYFDNIQSYKDSLGFKNILMISETGKILYASDEKDLVGTSVQAFSSSFRQTFYSLQKTNSKEVAFVNFDTKKYQQYAIVKFKDVQGYIALEVNQKSIQANIHNVASLGKSAQTYLAYKLGDKTYLGSSHVAKEGKLGDRKESAQISKGFTSQGTDIKYGSTNEIELVGYMPLRIKNIALSMQTTVNYTDIISPTIKGADYFEHFVADYGFYNIMIVGPRGDIFYSVTKDADYKSNVFSGTCAQTHLLKAIEKVLESKTFVLSDLDYYESSKSKLAQFALAPILKEDGSVQSIVIIQLDLHYLTKLLESKENIYASYESYVLGKNNTLRSNTFLKPKQYTIENSFHNEVRMDTSILSQALSQGKKSIRMKDYRDVDVLASFHRVEHGNFEWIVLSKIDNSEIERMLKGLKNNIFIFVLISSVIALFVMLLLTNEKKKQDKKLNYTATHDSLTGLPNRKFALEFLLFALARQKRNETQGAVLFIDLDKFKNINDSYGHDVGDMVLVEIADRLKKLLRQEDLIARLGGDEFIIVMDTFESYSDIDILCQKLIEVVSRPIIGAKRSYELGVSIGIASFPDDSTNVEELLQFADTAMYRTKDNGRNHYTYYSKEMTEKFLQISRVERELRHAIENDELELYYQPQIDVKHSRIIGVEALVRWNHPRDGLVMPDDFIPIAEESNLILDLGYWVTKKACTVFKQWKESGVDIDYIAVNMSTKQLQYSGCVESIQTIFEELDFNPTWLELEITESTLIANLENTLANIEVFKDMGIKFSIDDFGTGYSSLAYLKSLRISTLKIDREFIKDILVNQDDRSIVTAIIAMGHKMGYTIVAEGVESIEEVNLLKEFSCDVVQGFHYAQALQEDALLKYTENKKWIE